MAVIIGPKTPPPTYTNLEAQANRAAEQNPYGWVPNWTTYGSAGGAPQGSATMGQRIGSGGGGAPSTGYGGLESYPGWNVLQSQLRGELTPDVKQQIYQSAAERGIATGLPGAPITNAAMLRSLGLTSQGLQQQGVSNLQPLYMQQVSEAGQTGRLGMELESQMERLRFSETAANFRAQASLETQRQIAQMEQAGLDERQATAIAAEMEQLRFSTDAKERMFAKELESTMQRFMLGEQNQMDIARLNQATQMGIATLSNQGAMQRAQLEAGTQTSLQKSANKAAMERQVAAQEARLEEILYQGVIQAQEKALDRMLQKYGVDLSSMTDIYQTGVSQAGRGGGLGSYVAMTQPQGTWVAGKQAMEYPAGSLPMYDLPTAKDLMYYMNP